MPPPAAAGGNADKRPLTRGSADLLSAIVLVQNTPRPSSESERVPRTTPVSAQQSNSFTGESRLLPSISDSKHSESHFGATEKHSDAATDYVDSWDSVTQQPYWYSTILYTTFSCAIYHRDNAQKLLYLHVKIRSRCIVAVVMIPTNEYHH